MRLVDEPGAVATCSWGRFEGHPDHVRLDPSSNWRDLSPVDWLVETWSAGGGMLFPAMWLMPRDIVHRAGLWREDLSLNDDGEFVTRVVLASSRVLFCPGGTAYYTVPVSPAVSPARNLCVHGSPDMTRFGHVSMPHEGLRIARGSGAADRCYGRCMRMRYIRTTEDSPERSATIGAFASSCDNRAVGRRRIPHCEPGTWLESGANAAEVVWPALTVAMAQSS